MTWIGIFIACVFNAICYFLSRGGRFVILCSGSFECVEFCCLFVFTLQRENQSVTFVLGLIINSLELNKTHGFVLIDVLIDVLIITMLGVCFEV